MSNKAYMLANFGFAVSVVAASAVYLPETYADSALEDFKGQSSENYLSAADKKALLDLLTLDQRTLKQGGRGQVTGPGEVIFTHGASRPVIVCAVLELTDIAMEPGEIISSVQLGDTARWFVDAAISGSGSDSVQHLIVKPLDSGLRTSLIVTTDKRVYHMSLKSTEDEFMPQVRFAYPGLAKERLAKLADLKRQEQDKKTIAGTEVTVDKLDFAYELKGDKALMPVRVFNDGKHTIVEMPEDLPGGRMPAIVIVHDTSFFGSDKTSIANYRIQGRRFIVDSLFDRAKLILGSGSDSLEVSIIREKA